tara:strand:- start:6654 stop:6803 length:150 start_codon:yes stop_codon:yes gene_type:complete
MTNIERDIREVSETLKDLHRYEPYNEGAWAYWTNELDKLRRKAAEEKEL